MLAKAKDWRETARMKNKTEVAYYGELLAGIDSGQLLDAQYENIKLRLGDGSWYTPDFFVIRADGGIEYHEVKGFWREAARVRIKVAASKYRMFDFVAAQKSKTAPRGWTWERF